MKYKEAEQAEYERLHKIIGQQPCAYTDAFGIGWIRGIVREIHAGSDPQEVAAIFSGALRAIGEAANSSPKRGREESEVDRLGHMAAAESMGDIDYDEGAY